MFYISIFKIIIISLINYNFNPHCLFIIELIIFFFRLGLRVMKVKKELREFHLSVKDLIFAEDSPNFTTSSIPYNIRASKGTEIHQNYQKERNESEKNFKKEVAIKIKSKVDDWTFIISGRADCIYNEGVFLIIEEIKSVSNLKKTSLDSKKIKDYKQQLLIYTHYFNHLKSEKSQKGKNFKVGFVNKAIEMFLRMNYSNF